jgi:hypothetical protein
LNKQVEQIAIIIPSIPMSEGIPQPAKLDIYPTSQGQPPITAANLNIEPELRALPPWRGMAGPSSTRIKAVSKRRALIVFEKRWYHRLVPPTEYELQEGKKRARALLEDHDQGDIFGKLVISYMGSGQKQEDSKHSGADGYTELISQTRVYALFDSYVEFFHYQRKFAPEHRCFFEVIFGDMPQKPHFDIDIQLDEMMKEKVILLDEAIKQSDQLKDVVITAALTELIENYKVKAGLGNILLYTSHGPSKRSYHVVIDSFAHENNREAKAFYDAVVKRIPFNSNYVDHRVYSGKQQFRVVGSQKQNSGRSKVFHKQFTYGTGQITHIYHQVASSTEHETLIILYESLVGMTSMCTLLPNKVTEAMKTYRNNGKINVQADLLLDTALKAVEMLAAKFGTTSDDPEFPCEYANVQGGIIIMKRRFPSCCWICKTVHHSNNPYMYILYGNLYWHCRSAAPSQRFYVGPFVDNASPALVNKEGVIKEEDDGEEFCFGNYKMEDSTHPAASLSTDAPNPRLGDEGLRNAPVMTSNSSPSSSAGFKKPVIVQPSTPAPILQCRVNAFKEVSALAMMGASLSTRAEYSPCQPHMGRLGAPPKKIKAKIDIKEAAAVAMPRGMANVAWNADRPVHL